MGRADRPPVQRVQPVQRRPAKGLQHEIPVPPRGYWARRQHGQRVRQPPLPPRNDDGIATIRFRDKPVQTVPLAQTSEHVHPLIASERLAENAIEVPDTLQARHPLGAC